MVKSRFSGLDVTAVVKNLRQDLLGMRLANIYDINPKTYLLKLAQSEKKQFLLIESGIRIHSTAFVRDKSTIPSVFCLKLRKHLRTKRLESIVQLGSDRVIDLTFGSGNSAYHLIVEFYASGNVILTDGNYEIQTLLRTHKYEEDVVVATHQIYPLSTIKSFRPIDTLQLEQTIKNKIEEIKSNNNNSNETVRELLMKETELGALIIEHCILTLSLSTNVKLIEFDCEKYLTSLVNQLKELEYLIDSNATDNPKGYILFKDEKKKALPVNQNQPKKENKRRGKKGKDDTSDFILPSTTNINININNNNNNNNDKSVDNNNNNNKNEVTTETTTETKETVMFEEYLPYLFKQYSNRKKEEYETFDKSVDEYYSKIESQKIESQMKAQENNVLMKLEKVKEDQYKRIRELQTQEEISKYKAHLIEINLEEVEQAINIIRSAIANSIDWKELSNIIKEEKKKGEQIACLIHKLKLETNEISLLLTPKEMEGEEEMMTRPAQVIDIDIGITAYANIARQYEMKKKSAIKAQKTADSAEAAIKAAEKKTRTQLKEVQIKNKLQSMRKTLWFEKFNWFISSDNYLIITGKDAQQNEQLVKRYLKKDDIYVHADIAGAATCVIKNKINNKENKESSGEGGIIPPPNTLLQAGIMSVCHSNAWNNKVITSAYWVYADQVSKTAPSGEYLTTGSFMIRGKKNFLPPSPLIMGFGFLFKLHESSLVNHLGERTKSSLIADDLLDDSSDTNSITFDDNDIDNDELDLDNNNNNNNNSNSLASSVDSLRSFGFGIQQTLTANDLTNIKTTNNNTNTTTTNKYAYDEPEVEDNNEDDNKKIEVQSKPRISAKQKKLMKKKQSKNENNNNETDDNNSNNNENSENRIESEEETVNKKKEENSEKDNNNDNNNNNNNKESNKGNKQVVIPRGKKNKMKKMKEKYGEQDEEERTIKMAILGSKPANKDKDNKSKTQNNKDKNNNKDKEKNKDKNNSGKQPKKETKTEKEEKTINTNDEKQVKEDLEGTEGTEGNATTAVTTKGRAEQRKKEAEEIKKLMEEENIQEDVETDKLDELDSLTGIPLPDDVLLFAIPVCGPYNSMSNYKYKVKLTPGNLRRGKAAKTAVSVFLRFPDATTQEKDYIRAVDDNEVIQQILANVKVSTPGLLKVQQNNRSSAKKKQKNKSTE